MEKDAVALAPRLMLATSTIAGVAFAELGTLFCFNTRLAIGGLLTSILVLLPLTRIATTRIGPAGGFLVGITSLGCIPLALVIGTWEARGFTSTPTSDLEDFALLLLLLGGFAAAATLAVRRSRTVLADALCTTTRRFFFGALGVSMLLVTGAVLRAARGAHLEPGPFRGEPLPMIVTGAVGVALAIAFGLAARRTRAKHEALASGVTGAHRGDGWIDLDDDAPPVHRADLAGRAEGPVVVLGTTATATHGYRAAPGSAGSTNALTVTFGTPTSIRDAGSTRAASHHAVGLAILAFSVLPLVALSLVGVRPF